MGGGVTKAFAVGASLGFFEALSLVFFAGFAFDPTAGRQVAAYTICTAASGSSEFSRVGTGSATRAGNRR
jgi:hypothetical protein